MLGPPPVPLRGIQGQNRVNEDFVGPIDRILTSGLSKKKCRFLNPSKGSCVTPLKQLLSEFSTQPAFNTLSNITAWSRLAGGAAAPRPQYSGTRLDTSGFLKRIFERAPSDKQTAWSRAAGYPENLDDGRRPIEASYDYGGMASPEAAGTKSGSINPVRFIRGIRSLCGLTGAGCSIKAIVNHRRQGTT
jgi:hypothetical protein